MAGAHHGGAEAFFERLAIALGQAGLDQRVAIRRDPERAARLMAGGVTPLQLAFGGPLDLLTRWRLAAEIRRFRPDVVLSWMTRATQKTPRGRFVHAARLGGYYDLRHYRACDHLIGNTRGIADYVRASRWPAERTHYIPNFVAATPGRPVDRAALDTPADAPVILALGRLHANKAYDVLLRALAAVPGAVLWLAGAGPEEPALRRLAAELGVAGRARFLGWRDDTAPLFGAADAFVCSSRIEPFGNIVVEAWAARVPLVAARVQGPAALLSDGEDGLLVPPEDAGAMAAAIRRLAGEPALADRLTDAGRRRFEAAYSEPVVVGAYREWLAGLAG